jgi:hypothetical protein
MVRGIEVLRAPPPRCAGRFICAAVLLLAGGLALAPDAAAKKKKPPPTFEASVQGTQTTSWTEHYSFFDYDPETDQEVELRCDGSGSETVNFATPSPVNVQVVLSKFEGLARPWFNFGKPPPKHEKRGNASFDTTAHVERSASYSATAGCYEQVPPPSCSGAGTFNWKLKLWPWFGEPLDRVVMFEEFYSNIDDPLAGQCPQVAVTRPVTFPKLLVWLDSAETEPVLGSLSTADLFNRKIKTLTVPVEGTYVSSDPDGNSTTEVRWELTLQRVKAKKK